MEDTSNKITPKDVVSWALAGAALFAIYKVLKGTGLITTGQDKEAEQLNDTALFEDYTKPTFWKQTPPAGKKVVTYADSEKWIDDMWNTTGFFNDDEEAMVNLIRQLQYKTQYSFLADKFAQEKGEDLTAYLKNYFSESELYPVWKHLKDLPTYAKK